MSLVRNERLKLAATAMNGLAITTMATGFVAPLVAVSYGVSSASGTLLLAGISAVWFLAAISLPMAAQAVLGGLKE